MKYTEQLLQEEWKAKRQIILKRDDHQCVKCNSTKNLQIHHKHYLPGKLA